MTDPIGLLHPGEMGATVGAAARENGVQDGGVSGEGERRVYAMRPGAHGACGMRREDGR